MRQKRPILFYFFLILLSMQIDRIYSQLDFGDDPEPSKFEPEPNKDAEAVSGGADDGETQGTPVESKREAPAGESESSGSKDIPNNAVAESTPKEKSPEAESESAPKGKPPAGKSPPPPLGKSGPLAAKKPILSPKPMLERNQRAGPLPLPLRHGVGRGLGRGLGRTLGIPIIPQGICHIRADPGYCNLMIGRWYYDHRYHRCLPFLYTGCGGNYNNFYSHKQCEEATRKCDFLGHSLLGHHHHHQPLLRHMMNPFSLMNPLSSLSQNGILAG